MKRAIIILALLAAVCGGLQAQTKDSIDVSQFVVTYDYAVRTMMGRNDSVFVDSCQIALLVGSNHTMQMEYNQYLFRLLDDNNAQNDMIGKGIMGFPTIWTDLPEGKMTSREFFAPNMFRIEEPMEAQRWTLTDDTLTVSGYACKTASCSYAGKEWTACYTEEIPSTAGPWKLHGLPGLIVEAKDAEGIHSFHLRTLEQKTVTMTTKFAPTDIREKPNRFIKQRNKVLCDKRYAKNPRYYLRGDLRTASMQAAPNVWFSFLYTRDANGRVLLDVNRPIPSVDNVRYYQPLELK